MSMPVVPLAPRAAAVVASAAITTSAVEERRALAADARELKRKKRAYDAAFAPSHVGWLLKHEAVLHPNTCVPPSFPRVKLTFLGKEIAGKAMAQLVAAAALAQAAEAEHEHDDFLCPPADAMLGMQEGLEEEESLHASAAVVPLGPDAPVACPSKQ